VTVKVPVIVTKTIDYFNVKITSGQTTTTIVPTPSISIKPVTTTLTLAGGSTQVRTLTLPPYPLINGATLDLPNDPVSSSTTTPGGGGFTNPWVLETPPSEEQPAFELPETTSKPPYDGPVDDDDDDDNSPTPTWPSSLGIKPVETDVPEDDKDPKTKTSCTLWFFWVSRIADNLSSCFVLIKRPGLYQLARI
jgi:hypothetical protein